MILFRKIMILTKQHKLQFRVLIWRSINLIYKFTKMYVAVCFRRSLLIIMQPVLTDFKPRQLSVT